MKTQKKPLARESGGKRRILLLHVSLVLAAVLLLAGCGLSDGEDEAVETTAVLPTIGAAILPTPDLPTPPPTVTLPTPPPGGAYGRVIAPDGVLIRSGPDAAHELRAAAPFGAEIEIIGHSGDGRWWAIPHPGRDDPAWISAAFVEVFDAADAPEIETPSPPASDTAAPLSPLVNTSWQLASMQVDSIPTPGSVVNLFFYDDGRVSGATGCNHYSGAYTSGDNNLRFSRLAAGLRACEETLNQQETLYLSLLQSVTDYTIEAAQLILRDAAGEEVLRYDRAG